ncbi:MAG: ABC transporter permease, partial [Chloroflexota bacterium]|nr:ABC transporter permease [Chloroflexota bacterium]
MTPDSVVQSAIGEWRLRALLNRAGPGLESLVALACAFLISGVVLLIAGHDPFEAFRALVQRTLLRPSGLEEVVARATPLLIAGLAVLVAARAGLWNIGIDGQVLIGAISAAVVGNWLDTANRPVLWFVVMAAGALGGVAWMAVPALLRMRWGINEIVTTIMFNYLAISLTAWLVKGPFQDESLVAPQTPVIPRELRFTALGDSRIHVGLIMALLLWLAVALWLQKSVSGFELRAVGENPRAARHAMIPVAAIVLVALLASGALAGVTGGNDVLSTKGTFQAEWNPEYGLSAFALVFLARRNAYGLLPAALFLGMLAYGADVMPRAAGIP